MGHNPVVAPFPSLTVRALSASQPLSPASSCCRPSLGTRTPRLPDLMRQRTRPAWASLGF